MRDVDPSIWSDHSAVTLFIKHLTKAKKGNNHWKFNSSLVEDKYYVTLLSDKLKQWQIEYNSIEDDRVIWELLKYEIRKFSMSYCSQKKLDRQKDECTKKKELEQIEIE